LKGEKGTGPGSKNAKAALEKVSAESLVLAGKENSAENGARAAKGQDFQKAGRVSKKENRVSTESGGKAGPEDFQARGAKAVVESRSGNSGKGSGNTPAGFELVEISLPQVFILVSRKFLGEEA